MREGFARGFRGRFGPRALALFAFAFSLRGFIFSSAFFVFNFVLSLMFNGALEHTWCAASDRIGGGAATGAALRWRHQHKLPRQRATKPRGVA